MNFVYIAFNRCRKGAQILQVVSERLGCGYGVHGGKAHDDFVHQRGVLDAVESEVGAMGKKLCLGVSGECF